MKGIVLAGGSGTRLHPTTKAISKQLIPIYSKPMVYYPISVLMLAGIREILIISTPDDIGGFEKLLGDGSMFGVKFAYKIQERPEGIAQAFTIGEDFIGDDSVCLILGDNVFHGSNFTPMTKRAIASAEKDNIATVFGYEVEDPERYGVVEFDEEGKCLSIEEKPSEPKSNYAVVGLYFYPNDVVKIVKERITPSKRGELEITSVNQEYLKEGRLNVETLCNGFAWLDTGTFDSLLNAGNYVAAIEKRQGLKIACLEEIAYKKRWLSREKMLQISEKMKNNEYGKYIKKVIDKKN